MGRDDDPRLTELPMMDRDLKTLEKNLKTALSKVTTFFSWGDRWQLTAQQPALPEEKIKEIEDHITAARESAATTDLVRTYFGLEPSSDLFDLTCLALSHYLETKRKKDFLLVSPVEWGRWHLKSVLNSLPEGLALSAKEAPLVAFESPEMPEPPETHGFPLKVYLSWREIVSGGVRVPKAFHKDLSHSREYTFTDADDNKSLTAYYYPTQGFFLGFQAFFAAHNIPQGTSITLEKKDATHILFRLKKSKKKVSAARASYDAAADAFIDVTEAATLAMPNKVISSSAIRSSGSSALTPEREGKDLRELLVLVFKTFAGITVGHALHYLRAFHLVDVLRRRRPRTWRSTLLNSPEFTKSDKTKGLYIYHEALPVPEERPVASRRRRPAAEPEHETSAAPGTIFYDEYESDGRIADRRHPAGRDRGRDGGREPAVHDPQARAAGGDRAASPADARARARPAGPPDPARRAFGARAPGTTTKTGEVKKEKPHKKKKGKLEGEKVVAAGQERAPGDRGADRDGGRRPRGPARRKGGREGQARGHRPHRGRARGGRGGRRGRDRGGKRAAADQQDQGPEGEGGGRSRRGRSGRRSRRRRRGGRSRRGSARGQGGRVRQPVRRAAQSRPRQEAPGTQDAAEKKPDAE